MSFGLFKALELGFMFLTFPLTSYIISMVPNMDSDTFTVHRGWIGIFWSLATGIIVSFLAAFTDCRSDIYAVNRTKRTFLHIITFMLCEIYTIFVVEVKLQKISDVDASFGRSFFYFLEMFFFVTLMTTNTLNHLMLICYTFHEIEAIQLPYMTRLRALFCVLMIIPLIGILILAILSNEDEAFYFGPLIFLLAISLTAAEWARRAFVGNEDDVQCKLKSYINYFRCSQPTPLLVALVVPQLIFVLILCLKKKCYHMMGFPEVQLKDHMTTGFENLEYVFVLFQFVAVSCVRDYYLKCIIDEDFDVEIEEDSQEITEDEIIEDAWILALIVAFLINFTIFYWKFQ